MNKLILVLGFALALSACGGGGGGNSDNVGTLHACAQGYDHSLSQFEQARSYYSSIKDRRDVSDNDKRSAARTAANECVRHFETYGTDNCTIHGRAAFTDTDPAVLYQQCKSVHYDE